MSTKWTIQPLKEKKMGLDRIDSGSSQVVRRRQEK